MNVVIVGLGLIGGSLALALGERRPAIRIVGVDRGAVLERAKRRLDVTRYVDADDSDAVDEALASSELAVLAVPIHAIIELVPRALRHAPLVTDCGSTKRSILRAAAASPRSGRFVPGHPMAGAREGGIELSRADLFVERPWLLCPDASDAGAVDAVEALVASLGARPFRVSAAEHDRAVALTSHATQLVASALAAVAARGGVESAVGPAFEGATRSAGGPDGIWSDIFQTNADEIARALGEITAELEAARLALSHPVPDVEALRELLGRARRLRRTP